MQVKYLENPTNHVLRTIECYGGEVIRYHDSADHTDVVVKIPDRWTDLKTPRSALFAMPTPVLRLPKRRRIAS